MPRRGPAPKYSETAERPILAQLDNPVPAGHSTWIGKLLALALVGLSRHRVWRALRKHGIHLQRRRGWCVSTDREFTQKAADIVALYMHPPEDTLVLSVEEKPAIQALERAQVWLRLPNRDSLRGFTHEHKRHGTTTCLLA